MCLQGCFIVREKISFSSWSWGLAIHIDQCICHRGRNRCPRTLLRCLILASFLICRVSAGRLRVCSSILACARERKEHVDAYIYACTYICIYVYAAYLNPTCLVCIYKYMRTCPHIAPKLVHMVRPSCALTLIYPAGIELADRIAILFVGVV